MTIIKAFFVFAAAIVALYVFFWCINAFPAGAGKAHSYETTSELEAYFTEQRLKYPQDFEVLIEKHGWVAYQGAVLEDDEKTIKHFRIDFLKEKDAESYFTGHFTEHFEVQAKILFCLKTRKCLGWGWLDTENQVHCIRLDNI